MSCVLLIMGKQLLLDAFQGKQTERTPWLPFVGCHGGALIGKDAREYLSSGELIAQGVREAILQYRPDGISVMFDLQIEAEALGCDLTWGEENPPAVTGHVLQSKSLEDLDLPDEESGRIPEMLKAIRTLSAEDHDVALYGLITGPFTLALHLKGTTIFTDMFDTPDDVKQLLAFCTRVAKKMATMYIEAGCDIIASVDPMTSQISPRAFKKFVLPYAKDLFDHIREKQAFSSFFVCGHAQKNVEVMCQSGPDNISVDENIPLYFVKDICQKYNVSFGGNLQLTVALLMGNEEDVRRNTIETMDRGGDTGFILAPGCDLPYATPPENLKLVAEIVHDQYQQDVSRKLLESQQEVQSRLNLYEYGQSDKIVVDVITLDSEACAPCQYMVEAVKAATPHFRDIVLWREHKIKHKEAVEFMLGLMVRNIPTICIDGQITFVSTIPSQQELIHAIQKRINEKMAMRIKQRRNEIVILGGGCDTCNQVWETVQQAAKELGSQVELKRIHDEQEIYEYGVPSTPAVVVVRKQIKSVGRVPSVEVVKEWLKDLEESPRFS